MFQYDKKGMRTVEDLAKSQKYGTVLSLFFKIPYQVRSELKFTDEFDRIGFSLAGNGALQETQFL